MRYALALLLPSLLAAQGLAQDIDSSDPTLISFGEQVYADACRTCHGAEALGGNGPDIQGALPGDVKTAIRGTDQMPPVELSAGAPEAVAAYLMSLNPKVADIRLRLEAAKRN
ncbi:c-type cytochrome [Celeribacter neptunius]|uniref:Cytochrome C oxidase, cbb3-type, subunit III n=1 Tax=Celeribacter neptunius TaxID=588602 RepID=A0A1I3X4X2_9RHOB|nr:cytochrome c [Celeribacter neptunius]SFK14349.1 Cytochrome C oxidase, cbb3-type, subunit III [Celeribacter neptunius]